MQKDTNNPKSMNQKKTSDKPKTNKDYLLNVSKVQKGFEGGKPWYKNPLILILILFVLTGIFTRFLTLDSEKNKLDFGEVITKIKDKEYERVEIDDYSVKLIPKDKADQVKYALIPSQSDFRAALTQIGIDPATKGIEFKHPSNIDLFSVLSTLAMLVFVGFLIYGFFSTKNMAAGGPMMGFGDSRAKLFIFGKKQDLKFDQVKGADEAVEEVREIVEFLKVPDKFLKLGARIPKGVLLVGPPGTGKTLLARAIAGEAGVPFFFTSGSEFEEMLVGTGASRVRDLFTKAKKAEPSIIFIDEIDSIAKKRGMVMSAGNTEQTLNQILVEMDGFDKNTNVIIIAATNRPDVLDPAILRPGRFDRRVVLDLPDVKGREEIIKVHAQNKPLGKDVKIDTVAKRTVGFSGADIENMLNEAAIIAAKEDRNEIHARDVEEAASKIMLGPAKKRAKTDKQKKLAAYHEAGHAITGYYTKGVDKVHKIDIISRGYTGGVTMYLPEEDEMTFQTESRFKAELVTLFGGRSAEKLIFDSVTTGASSDIRRATHVARDMVKKYGMSRLGYIDFEEERDQYGEQKLYSEKTAELIDNEVYALIEEARKESERILSENKDTLVELSELLMEKEVIEGEEFYEFMKDKAPQEA
jgi:cell division protease FtsH